MECLKWYYSAREDVFASNWHNFEKTRGIIMRCKFCALCSWPLSSREPSVVDMFADLLGLVLANFIRGLLVNGMALLLFVEHLACGKSLHVE